MGSRGCTQGFIGEWGGVQIRRLGRMHSPMNAPIFYCAKRIAKHFDLRLRRLHHADKTRLRQLLVLERKAS
jgi:hypothetical protein